MEKVVEYDFVEAQGRELFVERVAAMLAAGWQPLGGMAMDESWYAQAMVRYGTTVAAAGWTDKDQKQLSEKQVMDSFPDTE